MRNIFLVFMLSIALMACKQGDLESTYIPRSLVEGEDFNAFSKTKDEVLTIVDSDSSNREKGNLVTVKFRDTTVFIKNKQSLLSTAFSQAKFLNSQKTAVLVQAEKKLSQAPFYIIALNNGKVEIIDLAISSKGKDDYKFANGIEALSLSSFVLNNDYLIKTVNGKVYPIKRQNPEERIHGKFFMFSNDKSTLVFVTANSLYQVNYFTGETFNLPISPKMFNQKEVIYSQIQQNFSWKKNAKGTLFLKHNPDEDRIVDIKEFKH
ncbi:hypothetical protein [Pedobacter mucosus]|uniref:hypothetical protein n=1 Tax=Pedobacter mucosus TaxID=2895286 RepID=UPI001EE3FC6D|nr:hypothetical protein [Pedobacter mucosus]UKT64475.1 hypothetical protein LOK61_01550 [Pedobacter mucosus]